MIAGRGEWLAAGAVSAVFLCLIAAAEAWSRLGHAKPEWTRKLVHLGGGLVCLSFPWLFRSPWLVLGMALALSSLFAAGARTGWLRSLHGVARKTRGSEYYPMSIFLIFLIADGRAWLFVSSVLVLAVGDAFAALIGSRYGRLRYEVESEYKSVEGSLVFLAIAFAAMCVPMIVAADIPPATAVLSALLVAFLVTGFEAISLKGTDNLFVPLGVCVILSRITVRPVPLIVHQNVCLLLTCALVALLTRKARSCNVGGTIAFALFAYGAWALGSELWALPVFMGFATYMAFWFILRPPPGHRSSVKVRTIFRALAVPLVILVAGDMCDRESALFAPFVTALAAVLAFTLWNHVMFFATPATSLRPVLAMSLAGLALAAVAALPWALLYPVATVAAALALVATVLAAAVANERLMGPQTNPAPDDVWSAARIALTAGAAGAVLGLQWAGLIPTWLL